MLKEAQNVNFVVPVDVAVVLYAPLGTRMSASAPAVQSGGDEIDTEIARLKKIQEEKRRVERAASELDLRRAEADRALADRERNLREQVQRLEREARERQQSLDDQAARLANQRRELARQRQGIERDRDLLAVQRRQTEFERPLPSDSAHSRVEARESDGLPTRAMAAEEMVPGAAAPTIRGKDGVVTPEGPQTVATQAPTTNDARPVEPETKNASESVGRTEIRQIVAAAQQAEEEARRRAFAAAHRAVEAATLQGYVARIRDRIRDVLIIPPNVGHGASVEFDMTLLFDGTALSVRLARSSGIPSYDRAVERAIVRAQPFPVPSDRDLFSLMRDLKLIFRPSD